jgi:AraC-like DNA-binding protein
VLERGALWRNKIEVAMPVIARYPKRIHKPVTVDPDRLPPVLSVAEVAALLGFSRWTIIRLFEDEPGVLILLRPERMHKRRRRMIRIPRAVYLRVRVNLAHG